MPGKYRNRKCEVDGLKFDSQREGKRYLALRAMEARGEISGLRLQVRYRLEVMGQKVADYVADFVYERGGETVVEDCKGVRTDVYRLKKKLMRACLGIEIEES